MSSRWPVIVVTGANGGVGFGICHRLILQLSNAHPEDAQLQLASVVDTNDLGDITFDPCEGLTLVMACRSISRAEKARTELYGLLDEDLARRKATGTYDSHAKRFRENLHIELQQLDLASMTSVFRAAGEISQRYPSISHIILNAGVASFSHINWWAAAKQLLTDLVVAVSTPRYNVPNIGERSIDGLGWVWQCNIFGHYALIRELQPRLEASAHTPLGPARVLWMSSLEALPMAYDVGDWQLVKAYENYALSKYQIDLIGTRLDADAVVSGKTNAPRHIVVQPGVAATSIVNSYHNWFTVFWMNVFFWLARWLGSPHHTIHAHTAGIAAVHVALIPLHLLDVYYTAFSRHPRYFASSHIPYARSAAHKRTLQSNDDAINDKHPAPSPMIPLNRSAARFGSETDRLGNARVGMTAVREWSEFEAESVQLRNRMEKLYKQFKHDTEHPEEREIESFVGMNVDAKEDTNGNAARTADGIRKDNAGMAP